jgi:hypothetical protein
VPLILGLIALITPRLVIILAWLFSRWFDGLFRTGLLPVLGFIFLPTTFLWYTAVLHWWHGQWTLWPVVGIVVALCIDLSPGSSRRRRFYD